MSMEGQGLIHHIEGRGTSYGATAPLSCSGVWGCWLLWAGVVQLGR